MKAAIPARLTVQDTSSWEPATPEPAVAAARDTAPAVLREIHESLNAIEMGWRAFSRARATARRLRGDERGRRQDAPA